LTGDGSSPQQTSYDFLAESGKYLQFSSQRIGHDRLQPTVRPTKTTTAMTKNLQSQTVQEEKPNSMFHQINEASYMNTKANLEYDASKEKWRLQNDEILDSSPFRFIGQPDTNGDMIPKKQRTSHFNNLNNNDNDKGRRLFYGS
jgi:hypothetical protein